MANARWLGLMALAWICISPAAAQTVLFSKDAPLQMTINAPFTKLVRAARSSTNPYPATVSVREGAGPATTLPIQLSARGRTRRTADYCQFPPLLLTFDKATTQETIFKGQGKLKLVTYCSTPAASEQRIVLEYLAYRLYNAITPMSFNVRAVDVTYHGDDGRADVTRFGFLIEDIDDVAQRNRRKELTAATKQVAARQLDARAAARAALFEFMIGNLDWDFLAGPAGDDCCHNSRFIAAAGATPATASAVVPVPYDFDFSGLINAPYAGPPPSLPVTSVTDRLYRGYCVSSGDLPAVIEEFRARRADMMAVIANEPRLNAGFRGTATRFMEGFFDLLDNPSRVQSRLIKVCR